MGNKKERIKPMNQIRRMTAASTAAKSIKPNLGLLLGVHHTTVANKMNDTTDWTRTEMYELLDFLSVPHDELAKVFPANPKEEPNA